MESQNLSVTVGSTFSQEQDDHLEMFIKEGQELKNNKKFKKLRSIKLSKSPSTRRSKSHLRNILFHTDNSSSQFSSLSDSRTDISKASPSSLFCSSFSTIILFKC
ncbi:hypothetical protein TIFTF001_024600 [Ficus carica]|uniref:Uncharacterized protein n=1 Tax=Ficus carica TaxID=3494 RepID=A0AA88DKE4_FICCA|nr:hypothetical protein TIFTF001_024600 [Ficus carica]